MIETVPIKGRTMTTRRLSFFIAIAVLTAVPSAALGVNFNVPPVCIDQQGKEHVTPGDEDELYADAPPLVSFTADGGNTPVLVSDITRDQRTKEWRGVVFVDAFKTYLLTVTYSPFLQSYEAYPSLSYGLHTIVFPDPGYYDNPEYKLYKSVTIKVEEADTTKPMPEAFLEMAPDLPGSSPYTLQADDKGNVVIDCFTALPAGNNATIYTKDNKFAYTTTYLFQSAPGGDSSLGMNKGSDSSTDPRLQKLK